MTRLDLALVEEDDFKGFTSLTLLQQGISSSMHSIRSIVSRSHVPPEVWTLPEIQRDFRICTIKVFNGAGTELVFVLLIQLPQVRFSTFPIFSLPDLSTVLVRGKEC